MLSASNPPIDVAVERQAGRLRAVAPVLEIEGLEPFVVHGREISADMHQAFEIVRGLLLATIASSFVSSRKRGFVTGTPISTGSIFSFLAGESSVNIIYHFS